MWVVGEVYIFVCICVIKFEVLLTPGFAATVLDFDSVAFNGDVGTLTTRFPHNSIYGPFRAQ